MNNKSKTLLICIYLVLTIGLLFFAFQSLRYKIMFDESIKQGAENTVTALQMVTACQNLTNVTQDQILKRTLEMFVFEVNDDED